MKIEKWKEKAACTGAPITVFIFADDVKYNKNAKFKALEYCNSCLVKNDCLGFAYDNNIQYGVYGGLTPKERRKFRLTWKEENRVHFNNAY
jgi:WhiB family redox-sensing transcriptional regulator